VEGRPSCAPPPAKSLETDENQYCSCLHQTSHLSLFPDSHLEVSQLSLYRTSQDHSQEESALDDQGEGSKNSTDQAEGTNRHRRDSEADVEQSRQEYLRSLAEQYGALMSYEKSQRQDLSV